MKNIAFVDGQNLHLGTVEDGWKVDYSKFRIYLNDKYGIKTAYYFLGYSSEEETGLYTNLEKSGYRVIFKIHNREVLARKKGNVDTDIVFEVMKNLIDNSKLGEVVLVSGDGDYRKLIDYLISKNKFRKILFPNKKASSLYKNLGAERCDYLRNIRKYIEYDN